MGKQMVGSGFVCGGLIWWQQPGKFVYGCRDLEDRPGDLPYTLYHYTLYIQPTHQQKPSYMFFF